MSFFSSESQANMIDDTAFEGSNFFLIIHMKAYTRNGKKISFPTQMPKIRSELILNFALTFWKIYHQSQKTT